MTTEQGAADLLRAASPFAWPLVVLVIAVVAILKGDIEEITAKWGDRSLSVKARKIKETAETAPSGETEIERLKRALGLE